MFASQTLRIYHKLNSLSNIEWLKIFWYTFADATPSQTSADTEREEVIADAWYYYIGSRECSFHSHWNLHLRALVQEVVAAYSILPPSNWVPSVMAKRSPRTASHSARGFSFRWYLCLILSCDILISCWKIYHKLNRLSNIEWLKIFWYTFADANFLSTTASILTERRCSKWQPPLCRLSSVWFPVSSGIISMTSTLSNTLGSTCPWQSVSSIG